MILTEEDVLDVDHDKFLSTKETEGNEYPVNLDLEFILGKVPKKVSSDKSNKLTIFLSYV